MSTSNHAVLCGSCKCAVKTAPNPKPHDKVACPRCGRSDRFDKVMAIVHEYVGHVAQKAISERLARAVRGNRMIKFTAKQPSYRSFRWIAQDVRF